MQHELKTWPAFFQDVASGQKKFEIRRNDRNFRVGDILVLKEYDPDKQKYTGDEILATITYAVMLDGIPDMPDGFIAMGIRRGIRSE